MQRLETGQDEPVIAYVNQLIAKAIARQASDVHLETYEDYCRIRFRCHGLLNDVINLPTELAERICTRLKILAHMDIAERRLPQDGRIKQMDNTVDIRLSTCPTLYGEKLVLRLLKKHTNALTLDHLGLNPAQYKILQQQLVLPQGLILITGPTGSGKTSTLYALLQALNPIEKNLMTVEDPIEIALPNINQIPIQPKTGITFAKALRAALRQDPDIIMVGEIRDQETAAISLQAAHTGHLVLSTLHTQNAQETIKRLQALGMNADELNQTISCIIAQRLVRKLCDHCKESSQALFRAAGCEHCCKGYVGRMGIFSFYQPQDPKEMINAHTLWEDGLLKCKQGFTTLEELERQLGPNPMLNN